MSIMTWSWKNRNKNKAYRDINDLILIMDLKSTRIIFSN
jgi:hypothetical protein